MSDEVKVQQPAPDFTLPAVGENDAVKNGQVHLQDLKGRTTVLYFYPLEDRTPVRITFSLANLDSNPTEETAITIHQFSLV